MQVVYDRGSDGWEGLGNLVGLWGARRMRESDAANALKIIQNNNRDETVGKMLNDQIATNKLINDYKTAQSNYLGEAQGYADKYNNATTDDERQKAYDDMVKYGTGLGYDMSKNDSMTNLISDMQNGKFSGLKDKQSAIQANLSQYVPSGDFSGDWMNNALAMQQKDIDAMRNYDATKMKVHGSNENNKYQSFYDAFGNRPSQVAQREYIQSQIQPQTNNATTSATSGTNFQIGNAFPLRYDYGQLPQYTK